VEVETKSESKIFTTILSLVTGQRKQQKTHCVGVHIPGGQHSMSVISHPSSATMQHSTFVSQANTGNGIFINAIGVIAIPKKEKRSINGIIFNTFKNTK
jgi:hypothetical protein